MKPIELQFLAGEGAAVLDLAAARGGRIAYLGMRLDPEAGGWVPSGEKTRVVLVGDHVITDGASYRKDVRMGHLAPADKATAEWAGVPWKEPAQDVQAPADAAPAPDLATPPQDDGEGPDAAVQARRKVPR